MTSVLSLEHPGRWRVRAVAGVLLVGCLPVIPLLVRALQRDASPVDDPFWSSVQTSAVLALAASLLGAGIGFPLGLIAALYDFPARRALLVLSALPLLVPSFLWAIGWSVLAASLPPPLGHFLGGARGCVVVLIATITPLVLLVSYAATQELSRSQIESALLTGGEGRVLRQVVRHALVPALLAAALGGILSLADPGPGQILGVRTAASELLTSFAAHYDVGLAARQCLILTGLVVSFAGPLALIAGPRLAHAILARQATRRAVRRRHDGSAVAATVVFTVTTFIMVGLPLAGLLLPLVSGPWPLLSAAADVARQGPRDHLALILVSALATATRTAANTLLYAAGAGVVATTLGFGLALAVGRSGGLRAAALAVCVALLAWPPAASGLGIIITASAAPPWLDPLLRSRFTVCLALGLRLSPISTVLALRAWCAMAPSWVHAAAVHGMPLSTYLHRVAWPALRSSAVCSVVLVSLIASADIGTVLLLHPPGEASLSLAIVTVMANAPETTVSALCLIYLASTFILLGAAIGVMQKEQ